MNQTEKEDELFAILTAIPPDLSAAETYLRTAGMTSEEVTRVAISYTDECFCEVRDNEQETDAPRPTGIVPNLHSTYLLDVIRLLLQYGLDPNGIYNDDNVMWNLKYIDNELVAADALALLLESGGDVELELEGQNFFPELDFDVFFDAVEQYDRQYYNSLVHCWMVAVGYRGHCTGMQVFKEYDSSEMFDICKLRNHRNYFFGISRGEKEVFLNIYDKDTLWEVARA